MEATTHDSTQAEAAVEIAVETMRGDLRDAILDQIARPMPGWAKLSEFEQRRFIDAAAALAKTVVRDAVKLVAHQGFPHVVITTGRTTLTDAMKMEITGSGAPEDVLKLLHHGRQRQAVLVLADPQVFYGQRADAVFDKDQPDLPIHDEDGVIADGDEDGETLEVDADEGEGDAGAEGEEPIEADPLPEAPVEATASEERAPNETRRRERARASLKQYEAMIAGRTSLDGISFNLAEWPEHRRAAIASAVLAKGGSVIGAGPEPESDDQAEDPPRAKARRSRRRISETEPA